MAIAHKDTDNCSCDGKCLVVLDPSRLDCPKCGGVMPFPETEPLPSETVEGLDFELTRADQKLCRQCQRVWIIDRVPHEGWPPPADFDQSQN